MSLSPTIDRPHVAAPPGGPVWTPVCEVRRILPDSGVAALVDGIQVAVFRLRSGAVFAIDNHDPCSGANVLARGIVGDADGSSFVASPLHKQRFDLTSGVCLDDAEVAVTAHHVRVVDRVVEVALRGRTGA